MENNTITPIGDVKKHFKLIPLMDIEPLARQIAVKWVENYGNMGFDIENKHKLASDFMNYARFYHASLNKPKEGDTFFDFNKIVDLRPYLLMHPNSEMITSSCLHYLGDAAQEWWYSKNKIQAKEGKSEGEKLYSIEEVKELLLQQRHICQIERDKRSLCVNGLWYVNCEDVKNAKEPVYLNKDVQGVKFEDRK